MQFILAALTAIALAAAARVAPAAGKTPAPPKAGAGIASFSKRAKTVQVGPNPSAIAAQDLTDDGLPDVVTADRGLITDPREERPANDEISILVAQPDGNFNRMHPSLKTGFAPYAIAIANIDSLKWPDIVVVNFLALRERDISVFLNLHSSNVFKPVEFKIPSETLPYMRQRDGDNNEVFTRPGLTSVIIRDLNHDGLRDLVSTAWSSDQLVILPGNAETSFDPNPRLIPAPGGPRDVQFGDFDRDGKMDLAVVMYATGELTLWKGDDNFGFEEAARFPTRGRLPTKVRVADINRDGHLDLVVSHVFADDSIVIFYGESGFKFSMSQEILLGPERDVLEEEIRDIVVDDFNGDGRPDIAAACFASGEVAVLMNESTDQSVNQKFRKEVYKFEGGLPRALCTADFDGNGHDDIAVALWGTNSVGFLMSN